MDLSRLYTCTLVAAVAGIMEAVFLGEGNLLANHDSGGSPMIGARRFRALFGTSPFICSIVWERLAGRRPRGAKPVHLLWALQFLKRYDTEHTNHSITGADEKSMRMGICRFVGVFGRSRYFACLNVMSILIVVDILDCLGKSFR